MKITGLTDTREPACVIDSSDRDPPVMNTVKRNGSIIHSDNLSAASRPAMRYDAPLSDFYPRIYYPFPSAMRFTRAISFCSPRFLYSFVFLLSYAMLFKHLFPRCYLLGKWTNFPRLEIFNYAQSKNSYWILILYQKKIIYIRYYWTMSNQRLKARTLVRHIYI